MVQYIDSTVHKLYLDKNRVVSPLGSGVGGGGGRRLQQRKRGKQSGVGFLAPGVGNSGRWKEEEEERGEENKKEE